MTGGGLYYEDFAIGEEINAGSHTLTQESAIGFAKEYDPQYYHIDPEAAKNGPYGRLIASGWQTAAISMRLKASSRLAEVAGGLLGMGLEELKWPRPVFPEDSLTLIITILEKRPSRSKPTHGIIKYRMDTYNQKHEKVMEALTAVWVPLKNPDKY